MKKMLSIFLSIIILSSTLIIYNGSQEVSAQKASSPFITKTAQKELDKVANKMLSGITQDMTTYEKAFYAYKKVAGTTSYEAHEKETCTAYGALVGGFAQCEGKANAYSYLLNKLGIPNKVVVSENESHAWNLVKMDDGKWYHCDPTVGIFLVGNKTFYKEWEDSQDWKVYDMQSPKQVKASDTDYNGAKIMLHKYGDVTIHDGWFYYTDGTLYTDAEKKLYNLPDYGAMSYGYLKKARGGKSYTLTEPSELLKNNNGHGLNDIGTVCGDTIYFYMVGRYYKPTTVVTDTYNISTGKLGKYTAVLKKEYFSPSATGLGHTYLSVACHNTVFQDIAPTYSNCGTKGRRVCKDCGEEITSGARVKPLKIKSKPTVKYSTAKKGKVTLKFANKYYKETSAVVDYIKSGGYQIQYRKKGSKKWITITKFSSLKTATKTFKLKSKSTYYFRVRYLTTIGTDGYYGRRNQVGPWSKTKTIKVK